MADAVVAIVAAEPFNEAAIASWRERLAAGSVVQIDADPWYGVQFLVPDADPEALRRWLSGGAMDGAVLTGALSTSPPGLVVCDVDSTLTTSEAIDLLAESAGAGPEVADLTSQAMAGELDYTQSLIARVQTLAGLPIGAVDEIAWHVHATPGAAELVDAVHAWGGRVGVVSGGFHELFDPLAAQLGVDRSVGNRLEVSDGRLTGQLSGPVVDPAGKLQALQRWAAEFGVPIEATLAAGDGANDIPMLQGAGVGVAFCAKPIVFQQAPAALDFPRLDALLGFVVGR